MKKFMDEDFLLNTPTARHLYHDYAEAMPIVDYHCHIDARDIAENRRFENITQVWLGGDHYKWRLMRANGVEERYITGNAPDREKFQMWAETLAKAIGNPLYHWSHLELKRYFGYDGSLNGDTAQEVWDLCQEKLSQLDLCAQGLIERSRVTHLCTTDDPADDLSYHRMLRKNETFSVQVLPAWRPDRAMNLQKTEYLSYLTRLGEAAGIRIDSYEALQAALRNRMDFFAENGCRLADHGLVSLVYVPASEAEIEGIFRKRLAGDCISDEEAAKFQTAFLLFSAREEHGKNWVMQLHYGCKRDNNRRMYEKLGPDIGCDCIYDHTSGADVADFLNDLETTGQLPKTILYSLNPTDNTAIDTILSCFQNTDAVGKLQHGSAWWFNDNRKGMEEHLTSLASQGLLANFVGMLTDSRSFLSYTRHEYFRRILCRLIGGWVEEGEYPDDERQLCEIIEGISYRNALRYFRF